jgi:hypothetical protein
MDNPETLATLGTQNTGGKTNKAQKHNTTQKTKSTVPIKRRGLNQATREWSTIIASYRTPAVL